MTGRLRQSAVIACLSASAWISGAAAQGMQTWSGPKTAVKLGVTGRPDSAFLMLALHRGYFDQHALRSRRWLEDPGTSSWRLLP